MSENTQFYQNKLLFAEDLDYQRYTPLMLQLFQAGQNETINSLLMGLGDALQKM
ncbi:hypothetical protein J5893_03435 [bacterium]|nr:hypothetical protein [bacterium]